MKILIKVTKDVLRRSAMCKMDNEVTTNCAFALALKDVFPKAWAGISTISFAPGAYIKTPEKMRNFMFEFDSLTPEERKDMPEQSFEIEVPQEIIDQIGLSEVYKILSESKTLELVKI